MATSISIDRPSSEFSDLPTEITLLICDSCTDDELLALCQTSRHLHNLALSTLLARHGITQSDILSGVITISTRTLPFFRLVFFASPINKLSCIFDEHTAERDLMGLKRMVSRLPQIGEVEVAIKRAVGMRGYYATEPKRREGVLQLLPALVTKQPATLLVLGWGRSIISRPRRIVTSLSTTPDLRPFAFGVDTLLRGIANLGARMSSVIVDPRGHMFQDQRICDDIRPMLHPCNSLHVKFPMLPLPKLAKWALVTFNETQISLLVIDAVSDLSDYWPAILASLHLPSLTQVVISDGVRLKCSDFAVFVQRHSAIQYLSLGYNSIQVSSLSTLPVGVLHSLTTLIGPSPHVSHILRSGESFPTIKLVVIDPPPRYIRQLPMGQNPSKHTSTIQTHFSFATMNAALDAITQLLGVNSLELGLTLPGRSKSKQWLDLSHGEHTQRVENRLHAVTTLKVCTAHGKPFSADTLPLLGRWLSLFPSLRRVEFCLRTLPPMNTPHRLEFKDSICRACPHLNQPDVLTERRFYPYH